MVTKNAIHGLFAVINIVVITITSTFLTTGSVYATASFSNDYPDSDATDCSAVHGIYSWCKGDPSSDLSGRGYGYRNCTDGVAYWIKKYTSVSLPNNLHDARDWDTGVPSSYTVYSGNTKLIEPGDVAQSDDGSFGHVGFVTSVVKDTNGNVTSFSTAEFNKGGVGEYSTNTYDTKNSANQFMRGGSYDWDHFIDVNGSGKGLNNEPWPFTPRIGAIHNGAAELKENGLSTSWLPERPNAKAIVVSDDRIVVLDNDGQVYAKEGAWNNGWSNALDNNIIAIADVGKSRLLMLKNNGDLDLKEGDLNQPVHAAIENSVTDFDAGPDLIVAVKNSNAEFKSGGWQSAWSSLYGGALQVRLAKNTSSYRIAVLASDRSLYAKDDLYAGWGNQQTSDVMFPTSGGMSFAVTSGRLGVVHSNGFTEFKDGGLSTGWQAPLRTAGVIGVAAAGNWITVMNSDYSVNAKDGNLASNWITKLETPTVSQLDMTTNTTD